jgi:hypothetical protein
MFRQSMNEFRLFGARSAARPAQSFQPALEVLEERIVLNAASGQAAVRAAERSSIDPAAAAQKVQNTITTSLKQYEGLQTRIVSLASTMQSRPPGIARQPFVGKVQNLINGFMKKEKTRFHQFQVLSRKVSGSDVFTSVAGLYKSLHQSFSLINRQVQLFRWLSDTTLTLVSTTSTRGMASFDHRATKESPARAQFRVPRTALNSGAADLQLAFLAFVIEDLATSLPPVPDPTDGCAVEAYHDALAARDNTLSVLTIFALIVATAASPSAFAFSRTIIGPALDSFDAAMKAGNKLYASRTQSLPHMPLPLPLTPLSTPTLFYPPVTPKRP